MNKINKNIMAAALTAATIIITGGCTKRADLYPQAPSKFTPDVTYTSPAAFKAALATLNVSVRFEYFGDSAPLLTESIFTDAAVEGTTDKTTPAQDLNARITPTANSALYEKKPMLWTDDYNL
jgi:hypothetical protein